MEQISYKNRTERLTKNNQYTPLGLEVDTWLTENMTKVYEEVIKAFPTADFGDLIELVSNNATFQMTLQGLF